MGRACWASGEATAGSRHDLYGRGRGHERAEMEVAKGGEEGLMGAAYYRGGGAYYPAGQEQVVPGGCAAFVHVCLCRSRVGLRVVVVVVDITE